MSDYPAIYSRVARYAAPQGELNSLINKLIEDNPTQRYSGTQPILGDFLEDHDDGRQHVVRGDLVWRREGDHKHPRRLTNYTNGGGEEQVESDDEGTYEIAHTGGVVGERKLVGSWWPSYNSKRGDVEHERAVRNTMMSSFLTPEQAHHFINSIPAIIAPTQKRIAEMHKFVDDFVAAESKSE